MPDDALEVEPAFELCPDLSVLLSVLSASEPGPEHLGQLRQCERLDQEAPRFIAATASVTPPNPLTTTETIWG